MAAAGARAPFSFGLARLEAATPCFFRPILAWVTGVRGCTPARILVFSEEAFVGRRGEELVIVFMFLSSLRKPGPWDFGSAAVLVRLLVSRRRGLGGWEGRVEDCIVESFLW